MQFQSEACFSFNLRISYIAVYPGHLFLFFRKEQLLRLKNTEESIKDFPDENNGSKKKELLSLNELKWPIMTF